MISRSDVIIVDIAINTTLRRVGYRERIVVYLNLSTQMISRTYSDVIRIVYRYSYKYYTEESGAGKGMLLLIGSHNNFSGCLCLHHSFTA